MRGYRTWPALLLAALGAFGATAITLYDATDSPVGACAEGLEWAAVSAVPETTDDEDVLLAEYRQRFQPIFVGCIDVDDLTPADVPDPRS